MVDLVLYLNFKSSDSSLEEELVCVVIVEEKERFEVDLNNWEIPEDDFAQVGSSFKVGLFVMPCRFLVIAAVRAGYKKGIENPDIVCKPYQYSIVIMISPI